MTYTHDAEFPFHGHVSTNSRDCDGGHGHDYIVEMNDEEKTDDWPEFVFTRRVISGKIAFQPEFGQRVTISEDGFDWHQDTDEGFSAGEVRWCRNDCGDHRETVYDQYAEMAGY